MNRKDSCLIWVALIGSLSISATAFAVVVAVMVIALLAEYHA